MPPVYNDVLPSSIHSGSPRNSHYREPRLGEALPHLYELPMNRIADGEAAGHQHCDHLRIHAWDSKF